MGLAQKLGLNSVQSGKLFSTFDDVKRADSEIKAMESRIKRANEAISSAKEHVSETFRNQGSGVVANIMAAPLRQVSMEYEKAAKKAEAAAKQESAKYKDDAKAANDAYQKVLTEKLAPARQKAIASMNSIFEGESKAIAAQMEKLKSEKPADGSNESLVLERDKQLAILEGRLERVNKDWDTFKEAISVSHEGLDRLASQMAKTGKIDPSVSYMQSSKIFTAGKQEEIKMQKVALGLLDEQRSQRQGAGQARGCYRGRQVQVPEERDHRADEDRRHGEGHGQHRVSGDQGKGSLAPDNGRSLG